MIANNNLQYYQLNKIAVQ